MTSKSIITAGTQLSVSALKCSISRDGSHWMQQQQQRNKKHTGWTSLSTSFCLLSKPLVQASHHNSFVDKHYSQWMSMLPHLLCFYFSFVRILFPAVPMALLLRIRPNRAFVLLSEPVTCSLSLFLSPIHTHTPPPHISLLKLTIEVQGEIHMFASGRGVKRGEERRRNRSGWGVSLHLNACLYASLLINFVCLISGVFLFTSYPLMWKRWCTLSREALPDKRHCALLYMLSEHSSLFLTTLSVCSLAPDAAEKDCKQDLEQEPQRTVI